MNDFTRAWHRSGHHLVFGTTQIDVIGSFASIHVLKRNPGVWTRLGEGRRACYDVTPEREGAGTKTDSARIVLMVDRMGGGCARFMHTRSCMTIWYRPSHPGNVGTEHVGFAPTRGRHVYRKCDWCTLNRNVSYVHSGRSGPGGRGGGGSAV